MDWSFGNIVPRLPLAKLIALEPSRESKLANNSQTWPTTVGQVIFFGTLNLSQLSIEYAPADTRWRNDIPLKKWSNNLFRASFKTRY